MLEIPQDIPVRGHTRGMCWAHPGQALPQIIPTTVPSTWGHPHAGLQGGGMWGVDGAQTWSQAPHSCGTCSPEPWNIPQQSRQGKKQPKGC